ncbi:glucose-6-phosphate dehydrogenase [Mycetocola zhadangensis]|uniref:Glucose-6-phosphate 1-dehydrogenase n=1 Tax=Mycetocola zhadangensis TaxID=1164595 RepID=A0A3L7J5A9_9MICO|nr:glucose-6-phosphate dehydrogenase [Mycetocola zhadangensis]RLQ85783.1 glucose-6-phosphate dehydrogenase [Mycetocola zhadangensis]GGE85746.1 glucose-6-phosphate 1-dehydrogenase [Mycetocola zhadangensis]
MNRTTTTLFLLGGGGDLSSRLLLPALGQLLTAQPDRQVRLIGVGVETMTDAAWRETVSSSFATVQASGSAVDALLGETVFRTADVTDPAALTELLSETGGTPAFYFALPPAVTMKACAALGQVDLPDATVLALEKPFGTDGNSAAALNSQLAKLVPENQIHRVDHFLGRSTVFNVLGLRFSNRIFEPLWNSEHIERVDIVYDEQLGLEGRAGYYDKAGALVDMIQSHLLQVMAIVAMEPPSTLDAADLRDGKGLVLRATRPWANDPSASSRRARYTAGAVDGRDYPAYVDEGGVDPARDTETLAEVTLEVDNWRWAGVPFTLRSGKALGERRREIIVTFKPAKWVPTGFSGGAHPTVLRLFLAPDQMSLSLNVNGPGDPHELDRVVFEAEFSPGQFNAYGEVLEGILDNDPSLSVRGDTAEQCWRIVEPVLAAWKSGAVPMNEYAAGSAGPASWDPIGVDDRRFA